MCGIVGIASASVLTDQLKKVFNDMLYFDVVRGEDSTGVAAISSAFSPAPKVEVLKSVGSATDFFYDHCKYAKGRGFTQSPPDILIGHNRYATQGAVNIENAHPFEFDNVVGVHNGTVQKWSMRKFHGYKDFEVDSQIIYSHLSHSGSLDEVWKDADGAMALVYWDKVNKQLNIIRNKERPMNIFYTEDNKAVLWSSEYWMASVAAMRHGVKLRDPVEVKPDRLFTFSKGDNGDICHVERDLPPFVEKVQYHQNYGRGYWQGYDDWLEDEPKKATKPTTDTKHVGPLKDATIVIREYHDVPNLPTAGAFTTDGTFVKVNIPFSNQKDAKNKIVGRGQSGYYVAKSLYRNVGVDGGYWCHWADLQFVQLKRPNTILTLPNNGFRLNLVSKAVEEKFAPWFTPERYMVRSMYETQTGCGCFNCKQVPKWEDKDTLLWVDRDNFFCFDCQSLTFVQEVLQQYTTTKGAA